jgi:uncharacterized protein
MHGKIAFQRVFCYYRFMKSKVIFGIILIALLIGGYFVFVRDEKPQNEVVSRNDSLEENAQPESLHPMSIESLRNNTYQGGDFAIEQELPAKASYRQYIASYKSEGLKIFGLLTVPTTNKPAKGFPAIMFIHGYIPPKEYSTTGDYPTYQARLASSGFVTFKPDLRGHGNSEGEPVSAHFSEKYVVDTLNALEYLKKYAEVDANRIGYWGHSNGGEIGLRTILVSKDVKAASLWAGVVGSYTDMLETYNDKIPFLKNADDLLIRQNGLPSSNEKFWSKLEPYNYLQDITAKVQLQHGTADDSVPVELSRILKQALEGAGKSVEYFEYEGDDHNIAQSLGTAWQRTIEFYRNNL